MDQQRFYNFLTVLKVKRKILFASSRSETETRRKTVIQKTNQLPLEDDISDSNKLEKSTNLEYRALHQLLVTRYVGACVCVSIQIQGPHWKDATS